jgi:hypothetical protein
METSWRFRGALRVRFERGLTAPQDHLFALTRPRRVRFFAFTLAR